MTADEYLTILAEVDAELANELRTHHMPHVEFAISKYRAFPEMVLTCVLGHALGRFGDKHPLFEGRHARIDREMDARLEWFK